MKFMVFALAVAMALLAGCTVEVAPRPRPGGEYRPQYLAQLDYPIAGCERGPYALEITNSTGYYLEMAIDGESIDFLAPEGSYAELPPRTTAYLCLEYLGDHDVEGWSYYESYGSLYPVRGEYGYFWVTDYYGSDVGPHGRQELFIDESLLYYY